MDLKPRRSTDAPHETASSTATSGAEDHLTVQQVFVFWLPLAAMWLMMSLEQPLIAAVIARLPNPVVNLAAFGLTFSLALVVESPVIMLLTAGTALAKNRRLYGVLLRFTTVLAIALGVLHLGIAITPTYRLIIGGVVGAPPEVVALGQTAFLMMVAWTPAIAFRRLWQGVLIRYGQPGKVALTTVFRLIAAVVVCAIGLRYASVSGASLSGASLGGATLSIGVTVGALVALVLVQPTVRGPLADRDDDEEVLTGGALLRFYVPLALTSFIILGGLPLVNLGLGRAPDALRALAVWPVLTGSLFIVRSTAYAFQEVVVALYDKPGGRKALLSFLALLSAALSAVLALVALTPLAGAWLSDVAGLSQELLIAARPALAMLVPVPALSALVAWYRGVYVCEGRTTVVTQAVAVNVVVLVGVVFIGLAVAGAALGGATVAAIALTLSLVAENVWLWLRRSPGTSVAPCSLA